MQSTAPRRRALLAGLLAAGLAATGCATFAPSPPRPPSLDGLALERFDRVSKDVYRSAQPSAADLRLLAERYGVKSVLKLNAGHDDPPPGMTVIEEPLNPVGTVSAEAVRRILDAIDAAPKPILIHCTHGRDRTGLIVALHKMRRGEPVGLAYADMVRRGFRPYSGLWDAWLRESGWVNPDGSAPPQHVATDEAQASAAPGAPAATPTETPAAPPVKATQGPQARP